jgi:OmpA-OmpF porin, OOP family
MRLIKSAVSICLMSLLVFLAQTVTAEIKPGAITLSPFVGGYVFEGNQNLKNRLTYGGALGYNFNEHWAAEAVYSYIGTELDSGNADVDAHLYRIDCLYHFMPCERLVPYIAAGLGGITFDFVDWDNVDKDTDLAANYGGGLKYFLTENIALRGDVRHVISFDETQSNLIYTAGLTFSFGGEKAAVCAESPTPKDSDGDGVYDDMDECPNTPRGVKVDKRGCPLDTDGDGVPDYLDKCPNTPKGVKVDERGCPLDTDGDGVPDYLDKCPGTPKGATVNEVGCWIIKDINFDFNKWDIKPKYHPNLDEAVAVMKQNPSLKVEIQGHTDNIGSQKYNLGLSDKRAKAVMDYFISNGIAKERLCAKGYGLSQPITTNDTEEGRAKNRRVELKPSVK